MKEKKNKLTKKEDSILVEEKEISETNEVDETVKLSIEVAELKDKWLRSRADLENFKKNAFKEKQDWIKFANEKIILDLCDVLDNFERALSIKVTGKTIESYTKGIELIFQQFNTILKKNDVTKLEVIGKDFDPNFHEALSSIPSDIPENKIVAVIQNGYMIGEKVIRHSRVAVSNGQKAEV